MKKKQIVFIFEQGVSTQADHRLEYNEQFVKCTEKQLNDLLQARGHVLINDVHDALGLQRTTLGCFGGWVNLKGWEPDIIQFKLFTGLDNSSIAIITECYERISQFLDRMDEEWKEEDIY